MIARYPDDLKAVVEEGLRRHFPAADERTTPVMEAMRYTLFAPGKRFRPVLTLAGAQTVGGDWIGALPTACAFEFIHTYSLIHDDLPALDDDELRRGQPTCHVKFSEGTAILAGDALLTEAFNLVVGVQSEASDSTTVLRVLAEMGRAAGLAGMVGGQVVDIAITGQSVDRETLEFVHRHKTGALIRASAVCGAILGGGSDKQIAAMGRYAVNLGLAFQITDDILDVVGSAESIGKTIGSDEHNHKMTFVSMIGVDNSRQAARAAIEDAVAALDEGDMERGALNDLAEFVLARTS